MNLRIVFIPCIISFAFSQCCLECNGCTNPCSSCNTGFYLIGSLLCVDACPSNSNAIMLPGSVFGCTAPSGILFSIDFSSQQDLTAHNIGEFMTPSSIAFNSLTKVTPLPTLDRGFYFEGSSGLIDTYNWIPSYLFSLNVWILPISPGVILSVGIGGTEYIRCETVGSSYKITSLFKSQISSPYTESLQISGLLIQWQAVTLQIEQTDYRTINLNIIIGGSSNTKTISNLEANYPNLAYKWIIGKSSFGNSFQGFLYSLVVRSEILGTSITKNLPNCLNNYYWDGQSCNHCSGSCGVWPWCVRGTDCSYCASPNCSICSGYLSSMCTSCANNESPPSCCDASCATCSGLGYYSCSSCYSGTFLLRGICIPSCPSEYTEDSTLNQCVVISNLILSVSLNDQIVLDEINGIDIGSNNTNKYPEFDINDPIPAYLRGYYFSSNSLMYSEGKYLSPWFSLNFWLYLMTSGSLFSKFSTTDLAKISFVSGSASVKLTLSDSSIISFTGSTSLLSSWHYLSVTGTVISGETVLSLYIDNSLDTLKSSISLAYLYDIGEMTIGGTSSSFEGYLWSFELYNDETKWSASWNTAGCGSGCSVCPIGLSCPTCQFSEYLDSTSSCSNCLASCTEGCRNSDICDLCKSYACAECTSFSGSCLSCIDNASLDGSGGCKCNWSFYWKSSISDCFLCDMKCKTCLETGLFECSICRSGKFRIDLVCINECPYGFDSNCNQVTTPVVDQKFDISFNSSYGIFTVNLDANRLAFFDALDPSDPVPPSQRGVFLSELMYLESSNLYLSHSCSMGFWTNIMVDGDLIHYAGAESAFTVTQSSPPSYSLQYYLVDRNISNGEYQVSTTVNSGWNYISFTFQYLNSGTQVTIFLNGNAMGAQYTSDRIFRPRSSAKMQLGYSSIWMVGYFYSIQIWNVAIFDFSHYINDDSCGTGNGVNCLYPYDKVFYNDTTNCGLCTNDVNLGCSRGIKCNQCYSNLCASCTGYGPNLCTACCAHASGFPGDCFCDDGYRPIHVYECKLCPTGCTVCGSDLFSSCSECFPNFYLLFGVCNANCPTGYIINTVNNTCDISSILAFSIDFQDFILLDTIGSLNIGNDPTNKYPNYDANDPWPADNRGYYFLGSSVAYTSFMFGPTFTITMWIKPLQTGVVLQKWTSSSKVLVYIDSGGAATLTITFGSGSLSASSVSSLFNNWCYFSATSFFNSTDATTDLNIYLNGLLKQTKSSGANWIGDLPSGFLYIGADYTKSNGFVGFLTRVNIYNDDAHSDSDFVTACNGTCAACPVSLNCFSDCALNKYPDTCGSCAGSCNKGCVRDLTCRLCKQRECLECESFSGNCTSCIPNASLDSGSCFCDQNAFYDSLSQKCLICDYLCDICLTDAFFECSSCTAGTTQINNTCLHDCPYGFELPGCIPTNNIIIDELFYGTFQGSYGILTTGIDPLKYYFWNNSESVDPIPAVNRGLYFTNGMYLETNTSIYLFHSFSLGIWIYSVTYGDVLYKQDRLVLKSNGQLQIVLEDPSQTANTMTTSALSMSGWNYLSISINYTSSSTSVTVYLNNIVKSSIIYTAYLFRDAVYHTMIIGKSTSLLFSGFIYEFTLWNYAVADFSAKTNNLCGINKGSSCLWSCNFNQYHDSLSGCNSCNSCTEGCRNSENCNVCYDSLCEICSDFNEGSCVKCISNSNLISGGCFCDPSCYWDTIDQTCSICYYKCSSCTSNKEYDCTSCKTGYVLLEGVCTTFCPLGYANSAGICTLYNDFIFNLNFNTLSGIIHDAQSYIPVMTGNSSDFYPNYDIDDPIAAYLRGFYFNGVSSVMHLPIHKNYSSPKLTLSPSFTISLWVNPENSNSCLFYKSRSTIVNSQMVYVSLVNYYPSLLLNLKGSLISHKCENIISASEWNHISFTIDFDSSRSTVITCFINTISSTNPAISTSNYYLDDINSVSVKIGAFQQAADTYINYFKGFLFKLSIYNSVKPISRLALDSALCNENCNSCPVTKTCIPNCKISEYWIGPSYSNCSNCSSNCTFGCKDSSQSCSLCYNKICQLCLDYTENGCSKCKPNASNETSCDCDSPYSWNPYYDSCEVISDGQYWGDDGLAHSCTQKCQKCTNETACVKCLNNTEIINGECVCLHGYNGTNTCELLTFQASLKVDVDNSLYLTFTEELKFQLSYGDFIINVEGKTNCKWYFEIQGPSKYFISIDFSSSVSAGTKVILTFTNSSNIFSIYDAVLENISLEGSLYKYEYTSPYIETIAQQATAGSQIAVATSLISSFVTPNPSSLWSMTNVIEVLSFITLSGIPLSASVYTFLNNLNSFNIMPNIFEKYVDSSNGEKPYKQAYDYGYETNLFLLNCGSILTSLCIIVICFPIVAFLSKCTYRWIGKKFTEQLREYKFSVFIRFWLESYIEIGAAALIGLLNFPVNNGTEIFNIIICLLFEILIAITPIAMHYFLLKNRKKIMSKNKKLLKKWDSLFYEFNIDKNVMSSQYYLLFIWRRLIYIMSLILLRNYPGAQAVIIVALSAIFTLYIVIYKPHKDSVLRISNIYSEATVLLVVIQISLFVFDLSSGLQSFLDESIIICVGSIVISQMITSIVIFSRTIYTVLKPKIDDLLKKRSLSKKRIVPKNDTENSLDVEDIN
ncbi:unnamed protein product [Blepharisma stoltei]|uniref:TNFR-Cys domain-containing protein n=1 Tax=Blepharisma stoltei TaxID=1481888 RepID=A0AAU9JL54_9CILI|nr:unnamed protein product [Blepharisma stoltei]